MDKNIKEDNKPSPRAFYDWEKEEAEVGRSNAEVEAIVHDIYRSAVYGETPAKRQPQTPPAEATQKML